MTHVLVSGSSDYFAYARFDTIDTQERFVAMHREQGIGIAYGDRCGWEMNPDCPVSTKLITNEVLDNAVKRATLESESFDYVLYDEGYIIEDEDDN